MSDFERRERAHRLAMLLDNKVGLKSAGAFYGLQDRDNSCWFKPDLIESLDKCLQSRASERRNLRRRFRGAYGGLRRDNSTAV